MAKLLPLASITKMSDMRAYAMAERAVAGEKCPGAYNDYSKALSILDANARYEGTDSEATWVAAARDAILEARKTWYAIGCPDPKVVSPEPSKPLVTTPAAAAAAVAPGGDMAKFLLAGGVLFVVMMAFAKEEPKKRKYTPRKKTTKRRYR